MRYFDHLTRHGRPKFAEGLTTAEHIQTILDADSPEVQADALALLVADHMIRNPDTADGFTQNLGEVVRDIIRERKASSCCKI